VKNLAMATSLAVPLNTFSAGVMRKMDPLLISLKLLTGEPPLEVSKAPAWIPLVAGTNSLPRKRLIPPNHCGFSICFPAINLKPLLLQAVCQ